MAVAKGAARLRGSLNLGNSNAREPSVALRLSEFNVSPRLGLIFVEES
jgi:hypothetical protein